jgi:hypothetical protein
VATANETDLLRGFAYEVAKRLRNEMLHPLGPNGRTARFVMLARDLLGCVEGIMCPVYGCARFVGYDSVPWMCERHRADVVLHDETDTYLAALLVAGWPPDGLPDALPEVEK